MTAARKTKPSPGPMKLADWMQHHIAARELDGWTLSDSYRLQLRYTIKMFDGFLGHEATVADLNSETVNNYLVWLSSEKKAAPATIKSQRGNLLAFWRSAADARVVESAPARIRKVLLRPNPPVAWSQDEMRAVLKVCALIGGRFRKHPIKRSDFWRALLLVAWDTALRSGDLLRITREQIDATGRFVMNQNKTKWPIVCQLKPATLDAIDAIYPPKRPFLFGGIVCQRTLIEDFSGIMKAAGVQGSMKTIRKAAATAVECQHPGWGMALLGHKTPGLAQQHYIDPVKVQNAKPQTPDIFKIRSELELGGEGEAHP